jgi:hypothetical protein
MREPVSRTYTITPQMYELLFKCCEKYYDNIAWKIPEQCPDGCGCCGLDFKTFCSMLKFEIPSLYCDGAGRPVIPKSHYSYSEGVEQWDEYDQFALLDYIEFFAQNCRDVDIGELHNFFRHYHLTCKYTTSVFKTFQAEVNDLFEKTGLLYHLTDGKTIERIVENSVLTPEIETQIEQVKEVGTRQLLEEAIALHKQPYPQSTRDAVEKIWDAFERLKTYYVGMDKKASASKIVGDMTGGDKDLDAMFAAEFKSLTDIGNNYRIRHHETNKKDIVDPRHYDYFFNRCLALIALAIQYLQ